jgi:N-methylhydantoinase B
MAPAMPDRVTAGHHADLMTNMFFGTDPHTGRFFVSAPGNPGGGWGAKHDSDGMNVVVCINDGDTHNRPVEAVEARYPLRFEEYSLLTDSGGAGQHRGGLGARRTVSVLGEMTTNSRIERTACVPWGLFGGQPARANRIMVQRQDGTVETFPNGKIVGIQLQPGDATIRESGGGGGYGPPWERPAERVRDDVREGYVSPAAARDAYGVVLDPTTLAIDEAATAERRAALARANQPRGVGSDASASD